MLLYTYGMLYCPQCGAEYREGYSSCSDCHVLLVRERPGDANPQQSPPEPGDPNRDPFCSFWRGDDPRVHSELCELLDDAGIAHTTVYRKDHLFNLANYPTFEIGVAASRFENAENVIRETFGSEVEAGIIAGGIELPQPYPDRTNRIRKLPEMLTPRESIPGPQDPGDMVDWNPDDATALVWSGGDEYIAVGMVAALNENDFHVRRSRAEDRIDLFVLPGEEARASKIIREIVDGTPPE